MKGDILCMTLATLVTSLAVTTWCVNAYKLTQCDFVWHYKCEVLHAVGIIPPLSVFTVWVGTDADGKLEE